MEIKVIQPWASICRIFSVLIVGGVLAGQDSKPFPAPASPGQAIQDAAKAAAHDVPRDHPKGDAGKTIYGAPGNAGNVEVLTDTQGVNFGPYLKDALATVRKNWYALIPADAKTKKGNLAIEFAIHKDGSITNLHLASASGDLSLDRAAWGAVTAAIPFEALPSAFTGPYLALRLRFYYNPDASDLAAGKHSPATPIVHAVLAKSVEDSGLPKYPKKGRDDKVEGMVRLEAQIAPDGTVKSVTPLKGSLLLGEAASAAIRKWTFHPARMNGKAVEDRVRVNVEFRLDGEQVRAQVVSPEVPSTPISAP
jgi:TonB family protein